MNEQRRAYRRAELTVLPGVLADRLKDIRWWEERVAFREKRLAEATRDDLRLEETQRLKRCQEILAVLRQDAAQMSRRLHHG